MADRSTHRTVVLDANVLINLIHAGRLALLGKLPGYVFVVPEDVVAEIIEPRQREELDRAISEGSLPVQTITESDDLLRYADLRRSVGRGEAACLVLAERNGRLLASDEGGRFRREAMTTLGAGRLVNTAGLFVLAIRAGLMSIEDADRAKAVLERHRFRMPFDSFRTIVTGSS